MKKHPPALLADLEAVMRMFVLAYPSYYQNMSEGPDDRPVHLKNALFGVSFNLPIVDEPIPLGF